MDIVVRVLLLCLPVAIKKKKKTLETINFLAGWRQKKNKQFFIDQQDSLLLLSIVHHRSNWEDFSFQGQSPEGKLGEQGGLLGVDFHWLYGFLCRNSSDSSRTPDNIDED